MFRDGQYLEVIKASNNCLATAVVTVQERTIKIKRREVSTNKWLDLEDWAALYKILERAILRNSRAERCQETEKCEWRKSTRQLEVTYTFEQSENVKDETSLPTIRVTVSPAKKKSEKVDLQDHGAKKQKEEHERKTENVQNAVDTYDIYDSISTKKSECVDAHKTHESRKDKSRRYLQTEDSENTVLEEYVPDAPAAKKLCPDLKYVPSRKSALERIQVTNSCNEYTPTISDKKNAADVVRYIPNSVGTFETPYETYEPLATCGTIDLPEEYVPNSKGIRPSVEEYQPDFTSKSMKFDNSYVPSCVQTIKGNSRNPTDETDELKLHRSRSRRKGTLTKRKPDLFT